MSGLREQVAHYLRLRRSLGHKLVEHERFLNQYLDYLEESGPPRSPLRTRWRGRSCPLPQTRAGMEPG